MFIGHRDYDFGSDAAIENAVIRLIRRGYSRFLCGGMGNFDLACAKTVRGLKEKYPHISLCLVLPWYEDFAEIDLPCDEMIRFIPEEELRPGVAILARNRFMIDNAAAAICFVCKDRGGAYASWWYALVNALEIYNI